MREIYCTSFCNQGHNLKNGRPVAHECYVLPVAMLKAEREGDTAKAVEVLARQGKGPLVNGR